MCETIQYSFLHQLTFFFFFFFFFSSISGRCTGAAAHGENKASMCAELFDKYKKCRKAEQAEVIRQRKLNRKGLFWD